MAKRGNNYGDMFPRFARSLQLLLYANTPLKVIKCKKDLDEAKKFVLNTSKQSRQKKTYGKTKSSRG